MYENRTVLSSGLYEILTQSSVGHEKARRWAGPLLAEKLLGKPALADHGLEGPGTNFVLPVVRRQIDKPHLSADHSAKAAMAAALVAQQGESVRFDDLQEPPVSAD